MSEPRRYDEDEVRRIFDAAAEARTRGRGSAPSEEGLTLAELQEIGREVGLSPARIAEAAGALDMASVDAPEQRLLGLPLSVGRVVDLPRAPTDAEWAVLVSELRETFGARGKLGGAGDLREWRNGNLRAWVEPTEQGCRLRLGTLKGSARPMATAGIALFLFALVVGTLRLVEGDTEGVLSIVLTFGAIGGALVASSLLRLPGWARERREQFRYIEAKARALVGSGATAGAEGGDGSVE